GAHDVRPLTGGASSLTYTATIRGDRVVVKVAPPGIPPTGNRDVLRQARLLRALGPTNVPVPRVLWENAGNPPNVPPLFVMSFVEGDSLEPLFDIDVDGRHDSSAVANRMRDAARTMARLHALEPSALGLVGEPSGDLTNEVDRWCRSLETVDPGLAPDWPQIAVALHAPRPVPLAHATVP